MCDGTLMGYFEDVFLLENLKVSPNAAVNYRGAIRAFNSHQKTTVRLEDLKTSDLLKFLRDLEATKTYSYRTLNNKRAAILTVWRHASANGLCPPPGKVQRFKEAKTVATAWTVAEVGRILMASLCAPSMTGWDGRHWAALVLVIYDTSHRIGALLQTPQGAINAKGQLFVRWRDSKHRGDTLHQLHQETVAAIAALPRSANGMLFPWPKAKREIWREFKEILKAAGLSASRRDLFHKLRRTSFTYVYAALGREAAQEHAAHSSDVTDKYLDRTLLRTLQNLPAVIDVLPRPSSPEARPQYDRRTRLPDRRSS